jgi:hypothetical protein
MDQAGFDDLAKALSSGAGSRRRVLRVVGTALVGAPLLALAPRSAAGSGKKRCRRKGGTYVSKGECHCAEACNSNADFTCGGSATCHCNETVEGRGLCLSQVTFGSACAVSSECPPDTFCVRVRNCDESGGSCTATTQCPPGNACLNGRCQRTWCLGPCPTSG